MNEEYLWDKSGHDPEIAEFENALRGFAYRETSPPALTIRAEVVTFTPKPRVKVFRYALAAAACLLFVAVSFGIWMNLSRNVATDETVAKNPTPNVAPAVIQTPANDEKENTTTEIPSEPRIFVAQQTPVKRKLGAVGSKTKRHTATTSEPALTAEELYAYEQLKLALSITSSKLKLVKEKLENHESETVIEDGR